MKLFIPDCIRLRPFLVMLMLMSVRIVHAQDSPQAPVLFGLQQMFELGMPSAQLPVYAGSFDCGAYSSGRAFASSFAGGIALPSLLTDDLGASVRVGYSTSSGSFSTSPVDVQQVFDETTRRLVTLDRQYVLESTMQTVALDLLLRWQAGGAVCHQWRRVDGIPIRSYFLAERHAGCRRRVPVQWRRDRTFDTRSAEVHRVVICT